MQKDEVLRRVVGLAAHATKKSLLRKSYPQTIDEKLDKAIVRAERRSVIKLTAEQKFEKARFEKERRSDVKQTAEQKYGKARVDSERLSVVKLTVE